MEIVFTTADSKVELSAYLVCVFNYKLYTLFYNIFLCTKVEQSIVSHDVNTSCIRATQVIVLKLSIFASVG